MSYKLTIIIDSLSRLQDIVDAAGGASVTVEGEPVEQKITRLNEAIGLTTRRTASPRIKENNRIYGGSNAVRAIMADEQPHRATDILASLRESGVIGSNTSVSSTLARLEKQGEIKRVAPGTYKATKQLGVPDGDN